MYIYKETSILTICLFFFVGVVGVFFREGGWRIGYKVFIVYKCIFLEKLLYTQLLFVCFCIIILLGVFFFSFLRGRVEDWILSTGISCMQMYIH